MTSMDATLIILLGAALSIAATRPDLRADMAWSGVFVAAYMFASYLFIVQPLYPGLFAAWWMQYDPALLGIPMREVAFGFLWGMVAGPAYEFAYGLTRAVPLRSRKK